MMQRDTIVPMLMMVAMFGMFIHYDLTNSDQDSVIDSIWFLIILGVITFFIIIQRQNKKANTFFTYIIYSPIILILWLFSFSRRSDSLATHSKSGGTHKQNNGDLDVKENLQNRIKKMLDESDKYDEFTVNTILKELEKIK